MNESQLLEAHGHELDKYFNQSRGAKRYSGDLRSWGSDNYKTRSRRYSYDNSTGDIAGRKKMSRKDAKTYQRGTLALAAGTTGALAGLLVGAGSIKPSERRVAGAVAVTGIGAAAYGGYKMHKSAASTPWRSEGKHYTNAGTYHREHYANPRSVIRGELEAQERRERERREYEEWRKNRHAGTFHSTHSMYGTGTSGSAYYTRRVDGKIQRVRNGR